MSEGRRGGLCQQLGVPVSSSWKACSLALPPFAPSWENLEGIMVWPSEEAVILQDTSSGADCSLTGSKSDPRPEKMVESYKKNTANALPV